MVTIGHRHITIDNTMTLPYLSNFQLQDAHPRYLPPFLTHRTVDLVSLRDPTVLRHLWLKRQFSFYVKLRSRFAYIDHERCKHQPVAKPRRFEGLYPHLLPKDTREICVKSMKMFRGPPLCGRRIPPPISRCELLRRSNAGISSS